MKDDERRATRRRRIGAAVALSCIALGLLVYWHRRGAIGVYVEADRVTSGAGRSARLEANPYRKKDGTAIDPAKCTFVWSAEHGTIAGSGASVEWSAPEEAEARVTVRATCDGRDASGAISLASEAASKPGVPRYSEAHAGGGAAPPVPVVAKSPPQKREGRDDAPVIDEILVEKTQVCRGEDNLVTVRAHDPKGRDDAWLHTVIDGNMGASVPLTYVTSNAKRTISVTSKDGLSTTYAEVPAVTVLDCQVPQLVQVGYSLVPNTEDDFRFAVRVLPRGNAQPVAACSYEWDFGDDSGTSTSDAWIEHSYLDRPQKTLDAVFTIQVRVIPCDGSSPLVGRTSLALRNIYATQKEFKHISGLIIVPDPRYPERGPDNVVRQNARIRTFEDDAVKVTKVTYFDTIPKQAPGEGEPHEMSVTAFLGRDTVTREWMTVPVSFDMSTNPDWIMRRYQLEGTTRDGTPVWGSFTLMAPPPELDRDKSEKVTDPEMKDRIMTAMRLLGKKQVTDEDMLELERQGKLPWKDPTDRVPPKPPADFVQDNRPPPAGRAKPEPSGFPAPATSAPEPPETKR